MRLLIAALVFTLAIAVTASVFAIWPVVGDAPWEDADGGSRFTEAEVLALVKAEVSPSRCAGSRPWRAEYQGGRVWYVATACSQDFLSLDPRSTIASVWSFREAPERIIPLNQFAKLYLR